MSPLEIVIGIAVIAAIAYVVSQRKEKAVATVAEAPYKVETPVVETPEVAPVTAPIVEEASKAKKPRVKKAPAEKQATATKTAKTAKPAKQPTTKAKTTKAVVKKAKIRVVK
jgi:hypothetical protein